MFVVKDSVHLHHLTHIDEFTPETSHINVMFAENVSQQVLIYIITEWPTIRWVDQWILLSSSFQLLLFVYLDHFSLMLMIKIWGQNCKSTSMLFRINIRINTILFCINDAYLLTYKHKHMHVCSYIHLVRCREEILLISSQIECIRTA